MFPQAPGIGIGEWVLIALLALIVVGPKDLPLMFRKLGQFVGRLRAMAGEFRASFDEMARQSELDELRREVQALRNQAMRPLDGAFDPIDVMKPADPPAAATGARDPAPTPEGPAPAGAAAHPEPAAQPAPIETPKTRPEQAA